VQQVDFAITINMTLNLEGGTATVSVKNVDLKPAMMNLPIESVTPATQKKKTYHDIILERAQEVVRDGQEIFTAADLYNRARVKYPHIKRNVFNNRVMAAAPKHGSYGQLSGTKDFLEFLGNGKYRLKQGSG